VRQTGESVDAIVGRLFTDPEAIEDPYPHYEQLRSFGGVVQTSLGVTYVTSYGVCQELLRDPRFGKHWDRDEVDGDPIADRAMHYMEPSAHPRLRRLLTRALTASTMSRARSQIVGQVDRILDGIGGTFDLMDELASRLPIAVIGDLLGIPEADRTFLRERFSRLSVFQQPVVDERERASARSAEEELTEYFRDLVARRHRADGDDLVSNLVRVEDGGERLGEHEIINIAILMFSGGYSTTAQLIGHLAMAFFAWPDQLEQLRENPDLVGRAIEECLRWEAPVQVQARITRQPEDVGGHRLAAGRDVVLLLGAANRDPEAFPDPGRFDITRQGKPLLSFGSGVHHCLGAWHARAQGEGVVRSLFLPYDVNPAGPVVRRPVVVLRGFLELPVTISSRSSSSSPS
jgi:cytochrome P450